MLYKPDWLETKQRLTDFWNYKNTGRPCIAIYAPNPDPEIKPPEPPESDEDRYLNPDWYIKNLEYRFSQTVYLGEALPSDSVMAGYTISYGARVKFSPRTVWIEPIVDLEISDLSCFELDFESSEIKRFFHLYINFAKAGSNKFLIGQPAILPGNDLLSMLMGSEKFLVNLVDRQQQMKNAIEKLATNWILLNRKIYEIAGKFQEGYGICWLGLWCPFSFVSTQSDISCMLSREMFEEFIVPELEMVCREFGTVVYHLDGPGALHHLDKLCKIDGIKMIQWVPGAGNSQSANDWLYLYKKIQDAGKFVMAYVVPEEVEFLVRNLDPRLLYIVTGCKTKKDAEQLLVNIEKMTH